MDESFAIIIASKNRPADIERAVRSIQAQTTQPDRLIIVDQSDRPYDIAPAANLLHHYDASIGGLTLARNAGIRLNDCSTVLFLDDDVELLSDVVAQVRTALRGRPDAIGIQCDIHFPEQRTQVEKTGIGHRGWDVWQSVFWRGFFSQKYVIRDNTGELERVHGCAMGFRADLFQHEVFDPTLVEYSFGEDWEFSKRARRHGRLYLVRDAKVMHHESPANRYRQRRQLEQRWHNMLYFYRKLTTDRSAADMLWLPWWMIGESLVWLRKGYGLPRGASH